VGETRERTRGDVRVKNAILLMWAKLRARRMRSSRLKNRIRMGSASRRRIRAGGPLALGRPSASLEQYQNVRAQVLARAPWVCQACVLGGRLEVPRVRKGARGGSAFALDRLIALCRACHAQTDAPFSRGRLVITPVGAGRFRCDIVQGHSKW